MRKLILKTSLFLLPILLTAICMEILLRNIPNDYKFKKDYLDQHAKEIETLILGSSHTFFGLDPIYFSSNTFNAGYVSQTIDYDYYIFSKYKNNLKNLKTIILPMSYGTLWMKIEDGIESWRVKNYLIYYQLNTSYSLTSYAEITGNNLQGNLHRLYSFYAKNKSDLSCNKLGWGTSYNSKNAKDLVETGKSAAYLNKININDKKYTLSFVDNMEKLNAMVSWCKEKNINIIIYTPPAFETYRSNSNSKQLDVVINIITDIVQKNKNCKYLNLLSDSNFVAGDYFDANHLSEVGAKKLSIIINEKISNWD